MPDAIKNKAKKIEEEIISSGGMVKNTICPIDLDGNPATQEYGFKSDSIGQNNNFYFYKMIDGQWKIILEADAAGAYISKEKKDGFYNISFSAHVSASERYWELYEWANDINQYEAVREWTENY